MTRWDSMVCAGLSICVWAATAHAQTTDPDIRCAAVSKIFAGAEKDPAKKQLAFASAFFFLGRMDARLTPDQLKAQLALPGATVKSTEAGALMTSCAKILQRSQHSLMFTGQARSTPVPKK